MGGVFDFPQAGGASLGVGLAGCVIQPGMHGAQGKV
jgi:hypothetical protein